MDTAINLLDYRRLPTALKYCAITISADAKLCMRRYTMGEILHICLSCLSALLSIDSADAKSDFICAVFILIHSLILTTIVLWQNLICQNIAKYLKMSKTNRHRL